MNQKLIILDLGANDGCSVLKFQEILKQHSNIDYHIYSFEPNPFFKERLTQLENKYENVKVIMKIAGTKNNTTNLYLSQGNNDGSSVFSDKMTNKISKNVYIEVEELDIAEFIEGLPEHDLLWVKMDIEGGEYEIIPHLSKNHCLGKINKLFIEWHHKKIRSVSQQMHNNCINMVKNIDTEIWDALSYSDQSNNAKSEYKSFLKNLRS